MGQHIVLFLPFCTFFKIFHVRLGKKTKNVSFYRRVCVCKGKTNIVIFFWFYPVGTLAPKGIPLNSKGENMRYVRF